ncbi:MAG: hypothetical protein HN598_07445 [Planctomycetes bacterium]|jgi:hypothetical protein|nr:hypothetical protein [Planctomycetota bacterium]MBT7104643.1 hypothetical protein [Planctomycetota bacterium]MBT7640304.1 hypothetical protein [Planctomycetota bacterium]
MELLDDVSPEKFEAFVAGPFNELWKDSIGGVRAIFEMGDRGLADGNYEMIWAFDSVAVRNSYFPDTKTMTAAFHENIGSKISKVHDQLDELCRSVGFTDYIVLFSSLPVSSGNVRSLHGDHNITLAEGVSEKEFEDFVKGPYAKAWKNPHRRRGQRGTQGGAGPEEGPIRDGLLLHTGLT